MVYSVYQDYQPTGVSFRVEYLENCCIRRNRLRKGIQVPDDHALGRDPSTGKGRIHCIKIDGSRVMETPNRWPGGPRVYTRCVPDFQKICPGLVQIHSVFFMFNLDVERTFSSQMR